MSHFSVLCIGDVEHNMAPFNEQDEEYFTREDNLEELQDCFEKYKDNKDFRERYPKGSIIDFAKWDNYEIIGPKDIAPTQRYVRTNEEGTEIVESYRFHNPDAVYDYYGEGYKAFLTKEGDWSSAAIKSEIDFKGMREKNEQESREFYRKIMECVGGKIPENAITWKEVLKRVEDKEITVEEARKIYGTQPVVVEFEKNKEKVFGSVWFGWDFDIVKFRCSEDEYIKKSNQSLCYGVVMDRKYYSRGDMGWWGISTNEISSEEWTKKFWELIDSLPEDAELTMLDCHI